MAQQHSHFTCHCLGRTHDPLLTNQKLDICWTSLRKAFLFLKTPSSFSVGQYYIWLWFPELLHRLSNHWDKQVKKVNTLKEADLATGKNPGLQWCPWATHLPNLAVATNQPRDLGLSFLNYKMRKMIFQPIHLGPFCSIIIPCFLQSTNHDTEVTASLLLVKIHNPENENIIEL